MSRVERFKYTMKKISCQQYFFTAKLEDKILDDKRLNVWDGMNRRRGWNWDVRA